MNESTTAQQRLIVVGASHAASEVVPQLRRQGWTGAITVIGDEPYLPYQRPPLSKDYFAGKLEAEKLTIKPQSAYDKAECELRLGERVTELDAVAQQVTLAGGDTLDYDKLILATGTRARLLPLPGADAPNMLYLRTRDDVEKIRQKVSTGARLLIIGGGYIGLEIAASAIKQGLTVTLVEAQERLLARVTSPEIAEFYRRVHTDAGVSLRLSSGVNAFTHHADHSVATLNDGEEVPFDVAIIGIGVLPNVELAEQAGLACKNGIEVNEYTQTSDPNIYAIGDCSNHPSHLYNRRLRLESVPNAIEQARTAAAAICGKPQPYTATPWFWSDQYDIKLQTVGMLEGYDEVVVRGDPTMKKFTVYYLQNGRLLALDAINSPIEFMLGRKWVGAQAEPDPNALADPNVDLKTLAV